MRLNQTVHNYSKGINIIYTTMASMVQELHNLEKEMEYSAGKLHQVDKRVEVNNIYGLSLTLILWFSLEA